MKRKLTYLTWGITLAVCGALLWLTFQEPHGPSRRLANGVEVELAEVTFGREHRHLAGNLWQRLAAMRAPVIHWSRSGVLPAQDEPAVWLHWRRPPVVDSGDGEEGPSFAVAAIDEHGCYLVNDTSPTAGAVWGYSPVSGDLRGGDPRLAVSCSSVRVYPRRSGHFRFALLDLGPMEPHAAAEFAVDVPPTPPAVEWSGGRPPLTARAGKVDFILGDLRHEREPQAGLTSAVFRYREAGKPSENWWPESVTVLDATGNSFTTTSEALVAGRREFRGLCRREPAWKIRVRFVRKHPRLTDAAFVWKLPPISAPARERMVEPHASARYGGVSLQLMRLDGGSLSDYNDHGKGRPTPTAEVSIHGADSRFSLGLISAADDAGGSLDVNRSPMSSVRPDEGHLFDLPYPRHTRRLHLTFGLFKTHTVEFLVKPP